MVCSVFFASSDKFVGNDSAITMREQRVANHTQLHVIFLDVYSSPRTSPLAPVLCSVFFESSEDAGNLRARLIEVE